MKGGVNVGMRPRKIRKKANSSEKQEKGKRKRGGEQTWSISLNGVDPGVHKARTGARCDGIGREYKKKRIRQKKEAWPRSGPGRHPSGVRSVLRTAEEVVAGKASSNAPLFFKGLH